MQQAECVHWQEEWPGVERRRMAAMVAGDLSKSSTGDLGQGRACCDGETGISFTDHDCQSRPPYKRRGEPAQEIPNGIRRCGKAIGAWARSRCCRCALSHRSVLTCIRSANHSR